MAFCWKKVLSVVLTSCWSLMISGKLTVTCKKVWKLHFERFLLDYFDFLISFNSFYDNEYKARDFFTFDSEISAFVGLSLNDSIRKFKISPQHWDHSFDFTKRINTKTEKPLCCFSWTFKILQNLPWVELIIFFSFQSITLQFPFMLADWQYRDQNSGQLLVKTDQK